MRKVIILPEGVVQRLKGKIPGAWVVKMEGGAKLCWKNKCDVVQFGGGWVVCGDRVKARLEIAKMRQGKMLSESSVELRWSTKDHLVCLKGS